VIGAYAPRPARDGTATEPRRNRDGTATESCDYRTDAIIEGVPEPMFEEIDGYNAGLAGFAMEEEVRRLGEEVTELGIVAEDGFKDAASGLLGIGVELVRGVAEAGAPYRAEALHARIARVLGHPAVSTDQMRRTAELQSIAAGFAAISEHAHRMATHMLALGGAGADLKRDAHEIYDLLFHLARQAWFQIRGGIIIASTRDAARARMLLAEGPRLDELCAALNRLVQRAIATNRGPAWLFQEVLVIAHHMKDIGAEAGAICRAVLHAPEPAYAALPPTRTATW